MSECDRHRESKRSKRKLYETSYQDDSEEIDSKNDLRNEQSTCSDVIWAIDPTDGREWVLTGRPQKPSIIPKTSYPSTRGSLNYRSKSTHFLR